MKQQQRKTCRTEVALFQMMHGCLPLLELTENATDTRSISATISARSLFCPQRAGATLSRLAQLEFLLLTAVPQLWSHTDSIQGNRRCQRQFIDPRPKPPKQSPSP